MGTTLHKSGNNITQIWEQHYTNMGTTKHKSGNNITQIWEQQNTNLGTTLHKSGNNITQIEMIRGKLFQDRYLHYFSFILISSMLVVLSLVGCFWITKVMYNIIEPPHGKTNNVVSEQARHNPACTITEAG